MVTHPPTGPARQPSTTYQERLRSPEWRRLRYQVIAIQHGRCAGCGRRTSHLHGTPLEVHHRHYLTVNAERPEDLVALCRYCHEAAHRKKARR